MKIYMWTRIITVLICLISLVLGIYCDIKECSLMSNILIGIFGSSLLTYISALVSYKIMRKEAIISYLGAIQSYRYKFECLKRHYSLEKWDKCENDLQNLNEYFYEMHYTVYLKIQHICSKHYIPREVNKAFEILTEESIKLRRVYTSENIREIDIENMEQNINKSLKIIQDLADKKKYIQKRKKQNGQTENAHP